MDAAVSLLSERGWEGFSMEGLAAAAGVGKATVYRRWAKKEDVVVAALERFVEDSGIPDTGSLRRDLEALVLNAARAYRSPRGRLLPALASAMDMHPRLAAAVRSRFLEPRRKMVFAILERARERGELQEDADFELIHDALAGTLLYRRLISGGPLDRKTVQALVSTVMGRGIGAGREQASRRGDPV